MCNFREAELIAQIEKYQRILNKHLNFPIMIYMKAEEIMRVPIKSVAWWVRHLADLEPDTLIMINIKSINCCDLATVGQKVTFAENVEITASEFVHLLDKGDTK